MGRGDAITAFTGDFTQLLEDVTTLGAGRPTGPRRVHECQRRRHVEVDDPLELGEIADKEPVAVRVGACDQDQEADFELCGRRRDAGAGVGGAQIGLDHADVDAMAAALVCGGFAGDQHQIQTCPGEKPGEFGTDAL